MSVAYQGYSPTPSLQTWAPSVTNDGEQRSFSATCIASQSDICPLTFAGQWFYTCHLLPIFFSAALS